MTKSLRIIVNGKDQVIAGAENAIKIACVTEYFPQHNKCNHRIYALIKPETGQRLYAEWSSLENKEIKTVNIEVIEAENPDPILRDRPEFSGWDPEGNVRNACSFCGMREDQVQKLVAGAHAHICNECIKLANEAIA